MKNLVIKYSTKAIFLVSILFITATFSFAQNSIVGSIYDTNRNPVVEIEVELLDEFERLIRTTKTRGSGLFFFQGLRAGVYFVQVRVDRTAYKQTKERIQIGQTNRVNPTTGNVSGSESAQVNLILDFDPRRRNITPLNNEVIFAQAVPKEAEKFYEKALKDLENKNQTPAAESLKNAIGIFPEYFLALDRLGNLYLTQGKFIEAENVFQQALAVNPKSYSSKYGLAAAQYKLDKKPQAVKTLEESAILNPASINAYFLLGKIQRELKEFDKAEINFKKAKELSRNKLADIHWELALLYYHNLQRYNEAADELELYLKANPATDNKTQITKLIKTMREKAKQ